jgi:hypothetical protein
MAEVADFARCLDWWEFITRQFALLRILAAGMLEEDRDM